MIMDIAAAIIYKGDSVLLARRPEGSHLGGLWEFPGGKVRPGEEPEAAARREAKEETGLQLQEMALLHRQEFAYPERGVDISFFLCGAFTGEARGREGQEIRWVPAGSLPDFPMPPANAAAVQLILDQFAK